MKRELEARPLVVAFLGLCAGLASGFCWWNFLFALLLVPVLGRSRQLVTLAVAVSLGWVLRPAPMPEVRVPGGHFVGRATVLTVPATTRYGLSAVVDTKGKRYRLYLPADSSANRGDVLDLDADIVPLPDRSVNQHLEVAALRPTSPVRTVSQGFVGWKWGLALRRSFLAFVGRHTSTVATGLVEALCLNVTAELGDRVYEHLRNTGTIHIVSASGLHVAIVAAFMALGLFLLPIPRWMQISLLGVALFLYAAAAGFHAPMMRGVLMVLVASLAYLVRREPDGLSAVSLAGIINLLVEKEAVGTLGFQLSYLAVAALLMFGHSERVRSQDTLVRTVGVRAQFLARSSLVASLATAPLLAYTFGQVPLASVLANLLVVPVLPLVVVASISAWSMAPLSLAVAVGVIKTVIEPLTGWVLAVVETMGSWSWSILHVPPFSPYWLVLVYGLAAALYAPRMRPAD